MEMQGLKPSVLMGKLKQHLPPGVSPDNDLFLAMYLRHFGKHSKSIAKLFRNVYIVADTLRGMPK
jgi:hypothetical protein